MSSIDPPEHLYFHVPFCAKLCPYCCFHVDTSFRLKNRRFLDALAAEVRRAAAARARGRLAPRTIYFGGGTPTALSISEWRYLREALEESIDFGAVSEFTVEANPATVSPDKAKALLEIGVNRVSLGVQAWDDATLAQLGRNHSADEALETFRALRDAGFGNIGIDLMFAVPGQTLQQWEDGIAFTARLAPEHVSAYCLTYEEDTEFFKKLGAGEFASDTEIEARMFEMAMDLFPGAGLAQYEISNYARPGRESLHNVAAWRGADYLGFGPSAFSTVGLDRWQNAPDTAAYTARSLAGEEAVGFRETLAPLTRRGELAAFGLRTAEGVSAALLEPWAETLQPLIDRGLLESDSGRARLSRRGRLLADGVAESFV